MFSSAESLNKIRSLQKRALSFLYDSFDSSCESILKLAGKITMYVTRLKSIFVETFKTGHNINPAFSNGIFELRRTKKAVRNQCKLNLEVPVINQITFGA